jgi:hypothetical protein
MDTVANLTVAEELSFIRAIAGSRGWSLLEVDPLQFLLGLPARDRSFFHLWVNCEGYPVTPAAWYWCDGKGNGRADRRHAPKGTGFLHERGVVCAPWNRLAYSSFDPRGPHGDWLPGDWRNNSHTQGCKTLCAMALRIAVELMSERFHNERLAA